MRPVGIPPGSDREVTEKLIGLLGATLDEIQRPALPRPRLPEAEHVHREHRLIPALITIESWLKEVHHDHTFVGRCGYCSDVGCWAHTLARTLLGK